MFSKSKRPLWFWIAGTLALMVGVATFANEHGRQITINTLWLGLASSLIALPLAAVIVWATRPSSWISRLLLVTTIGMLGIPVILQASAWDSAFGKLGWLTSQQGQVLQPIITGWWAAIWIHGVAAAPTAAIIFMIGLSLGGRSYEEPAALETGRSSVFWYVTLPRLLPVVVAAAVWTMIGCAREIAVTDLYQIGTVAEQVYLGFALGELRFNMGNWSSEQIQRAENLGLFTTLVTTAWLMLASIWLFQRMLPTKSESDLQPDAGAEVLHTTARSAVAALTLLLIVAIPLVNLLLRASFTVVNIDGTPTPSYSVNQIFSATGRALTAQRDAFCWSTTIAFCSSAIIMLAGAVLAWFSRRSRFWKWVLLLSLALACATPGPLMGKGLAFLLGNTQAPFLNWLYNYTIFAPMVANLCFCWPMGAILVWFLFGNVGSDTVENARIEGANEMTLLFQMGVLSQWRGLLGCWLIVMAICFGELSASRLVMPAGMQTVPSSVLGFMHAGVDEMTATLTIITSLGLIAISLIGWSIVRLNQTRFDRKW